MSFNKGITIIETKNHAYNVYLVCVRTENPGEEITDAEEKRTKKKTQVVGVKSKNPSLQTVIPDSDDEADSDDSIGSIIPSSQEDIKKSSFIRYRRNTDKNISKESHVSESSRLHLSEVSVHKAETQEVYSTKEVVSGSSSIHKPDTQEIGFKNMYKRFKPEFTKQVNVASTKSGHKNQVGDHQSNEETTIIKDTKDDEMGEHQPNDIHDMKTQLILKIPEIQGGEKLATNVSIPNEDLEVGDSQLCDFGEFTEELEIPESQSLLINMDQVPDQVYPHLITNQLKIIQKKTMQK